MENNGNNDFNGADKSELIGSYTADKR